MKKLIEQIHQLIIDNQISDALNLMKSLADESEEINRIVLLQARWDAYQKEELADITEEHVLDKKLNKIRLHTLQFINQLTATTEQDTAVLETLLDHLEITHQTFIAQTRIRKQLLKSIYLRYPDKKRRNVVNVLSELYEEMTDDEKRLHASIRGYTQNIIKKYHDQTIHLLITNQQLKKKIKALRHLEKHIIIWLSKYESTFVNNPSVALVYVSIEEKH